MSGSMTQLVLFRALQGVGAGCRLISKVHTVKQVPCPDLRGFPAKPGSNRPQLDIL
jgi:hypothetical protein